MSRQQKREQKRRYQKAAKRLEKIAAKTGLPVTFDNTTVTAYGNFGLFEAMKQIIGFTDMLRWDLTIKRHHNCTYSAAELIETIIDSAALGLLRFSHKRCDVENRLDELKVGVGVDQTSQHEMLRNTAFMWLKILAYNLLNWFQLALLPENITYCEINTIRRLILNVPGNIVGSGRYRHVRLAPNRWLQEVVSVIKTRLQEFIRQRAWLLVASG